MSVRFHAGPVSFGFRRNRRGSYNWLGTLFIWLIIGGILQLPAVLLGKIPDVGVVFYWPLMILGLVAWVFAIYSVNKAE